MKTYAYSIKDYSGENSSATMYVQDSVTAASDLTALGLAIETISRGRTQRVTLSEIVPGTAGPATDEDANRELKLLVAYQDQSTGKLYSFTIPCILASDFVRVEGTDFVDITQPPMAALVTAFEANGASEFGNAVNVQYAKIVGRNN